MEGVVDCVGRDEVVQTLRQLKIGITSKPSGVSFELIAVSKD